MRRIAWDTRFFATTRGRVLALLRREPQTIDDLAMQLEITDNAVRSHIAALERDGFVAQEGVRRGVGKPASIYTLTTDAERVFPKPYASVLETLLGVLAERLPDDALEAALDEVGRRMAARVPAATGPLEARLPVAIEAIANMGGAAEIDTSDHTIVIRGYDCPISSAVRSHPDACRVLQSLLSELLGTPVTEQCDRSDPPHCCFAVQREETETAASQSRP
jgi:predicted ArsR family transcriptional regulator